MVLGENKKQSKILSTTKLFFHKVALDMFFILFQKLLVTLFLSTSCSV